MLKNWFVFTVVVLFLASCSGKKTQLAKEKFKQASNAFSNEKIDTAITLFSECIKLDDGISTAYFNRANCYVAKKDFDKAIDDLNTYIDLQPSHSNAYFLRGWAYHFKNKTNDAIKDYTKAITLKPDYTDAIFNRGMEYFAIKDSVRGCNDMHNALNFGYKLAQDMINEACTNK